MTHPLQSRLSEAVDFALAGGLLKYTASARLEHAPFSLTPCPLPAALHGELTALTPLFSRLAHAVSRDSAFLRDTLEPAARSDPFTAQLLALLPQATGHGNSLPLQPTYLGLFRSDYFSHQAAPDLSAGLGAALGAVAPPAVARQVELNTISASYLALAPRAAALHRYLLADTPAGEALAANDPLPAVARTFAQAWRHYGHAQGQVLFVVQGDEANVFDQRLLQYALQGEGLPVLRATLERIGTEATLRAGRLWLQGQPCAVTYFRAGYGPEDHGSPAALKARAMIAASDTIAVPDAATQLAGAKLVQQRLTDPAVLRRYLPAAAAARVEACFAAQWELEHALPTTAGERPAWQVALDAPGDWVLKPQREGGGHNYFDAALQQQLAVLTPEQRKAYVLMERIRPTPHPAVLVRERQAEQASAVSEIGRFGIYLAHGEQAGAAAVEINEDVGYLVRTKRHDTTEGGVSAGFGFLSSLQVV